MKKALPYIFADLQQLTRHTISFYGHQIETSRWRLVIYYSIALPSQPRNTTVVSC